MRKTAKYNRAMSRELMTSIVSSRIESRATCSREIAIAVVSLKWSILAAKLANSLFVFLVDVCVCVSIYVV